MALIRQNFCHMGILTSLIDRKNYMMTFLIRQNFRKIISYPTKLQKSFCYPTKLPNFAEK